MSVTAPAQPRGGTPDGGHPARRRGRDPRPDSEEFARLTDPYRAELTAYCYRMLGSIHDAEDQVQETLLRAWRSFHSYEGRASLRTWLYRIATNACLRALEQGSRRPLPSGLGAPGDHPDGPLSALRPDIPWLEPIPDALYGVEPADPGAVVVSRQSMRLALVAAVQYLPPRQRAVLLLREVLGWRAAEVADLLDTTTAAVNSTLQRAHATLTRAGLPRAGTSRPDDDPDRAGSDLASPTEAPDAVPEPTDPAVRTLADRYAAAFADADVPALMRLLRADAVFEMPPQPQWFAGRDAIGRFLAAYVLRTPDAFRLRPTAANGQPALATYDLRQDGRHHAHAIQVLTCTTNAITRITAFHDPRLFPVFGLPDVLD